MHALNRLVLAEHVIHIEEARSGQGKGPNSAQCQSVSPARQDR